MRADLLFEENFLALGVLESILLECLIADHGVIGAGAYGSTNDALRRVTDSTYGSIMSVPVFLSANCLGPFHFLHTHLQRLSVH